LLDSLQLCDDGNDHRAALGRFEQVVAHARFDRALELADVTAAATQHALGGGRETEAAQ